MGAGRPDFGLYAAKQLQRGRPREGQAPRVRRRRGQAQPATTRGLPPRARRSAATGPGTASCSSPTPATSCCSARTPRATPSGWRPSGSRGHRTSSSPGSKRPAPSPGKSARPWASTSAAPSPTAQPLVEPKDLAWLLASYARDGLARVEAAGDAPVAPGRAHGLGGGPGRPLRGRARRRLLPLHPRPDPLLRHLLRMGALGAAERRRPLAGSTGMTAVWHLRAPVLQGALPAAVRPRAPPAPGPRRGAGLDRRRPGPRRPRGLLRPLQRGRGRTPTSTSRSSRPSTPPPQAARRLVHPRPRWCATWSPASTAP